ncbi:sulfite exporter TauE/SafE family protein [Shewanella marina]|uniref:sulfite exporter TauE/SafE family protein n=1 Tax=Shewanella marina TaxID=487319 RepID=UPI00046FF550|nr:TSUP family transporter [Shewanella marina]
MEFLLEPNHWLLLASIGFIAGFIDAIVGGGGLLSIPTLLTLGLPPHIALGTNKLAACFGSFISTLTYYRQRLFLPKFWFQTLFASIIGGMLGSSLVYLIDNRWLDKILPIIIIAIAIYTLCAPTAIADHKQPPNTAPSIKKQWLQGLPLGFYDGFAGPGIGAFWTLTSSKLHKLPLLHSCAHARAMTLASNISALTVFLVLGQVDISIGLAMGFCMMLGSYLGARSAIKFGSPFIKPIFITIVICIALNLAWGAWF